MPFQKFTADNVFDGYRFLHDTVLIIADDGTIHDLVPAFEAGDGVRTFNGIISPGFVNCHCHLELSHLEGMIPEKIGLVDFVFNVVTQRHSADDMIQQAIENAEDQMLHNGIVAVGDICNNTSTLQQKRKKRLCYHNFIEATGWLPSVADVRFKQASAICHEFESGHAGVGNSIVPHAPYSVSEGLWEKLQSSFAGKIVSIHNQEAACEDEFFLYGTGDFTRMYQLMNIDNTHHVPTCKTSLQSYFHHLSGADHAILVHNTFITEEDIVYVRRQTANRKSSAPEVSQAPQTASGKPEIFFCLCPNANIYIENTLPHVEVLRKHNCSIVLGTDSLASNWSLSILDEIKTLRRNFPQISSEEMLRWATSNGAEALKMLDDLGTFEKGKTPGVIHISSDLSAAKRIL